VQEEWNEMGDGCNEEGWRNDNVGKQVKYVIQRWKMREAGEDRRKYWRRR
jgi:hypothetical protein